jgi:hypothetical protein
MWLLMNVTVDECDCWWIWLSMNMTVDEYDCWWICYCSVTINKYQWLLCKTVNKKPYKELLSLRKLRKKSDKILILKKILLDVDLAMMYIKKWDW